MLLRRVSRYLLRFSCAFVLAASFAGGCSRQPEGERCDAVRAGDSDCDDNLVCVACEFLQDSSTDRCCRADGSFSDARCARGDAPAGRCVARGSGGTAGTGNTGTGGTAGTGNTGTGGTAGTEATTGGTSGTDGTGEGGTETGGSGSGG